MAWRQERVKVVLERTGQFDLNESPILWISELSESAFLNREISQELFHSSQYILHLKDIKNGAIGKIH